MKQQHKKQKIQAKKHVKVEQSPVKFEDKNKKVLHSQNSKGVENLPTIQNMLEIPKEERTKRVKDLFIKVKPFVASYMIKKQGSRVLQLFYKWGSEDIKASIFEAIVKNWKQLIKSKYALYTISKVSMDHDIPNLVNDVFTLQNNSEGAVTIENFIAKNPEGEKVQQIYSKIQSIAANVNEGGLQSQQTLHNLAMKSIDKGYFNLRLSKLILRLTLSNLFDAEKTKAIDFLIENCKHILDEEQGIKLFIQLVNISDSKQKKQLIKHFKTHLKEILGMSTVSYIAILKLFTETDDTVSIGKKLMPQLLQILPEIEENKKLYNVLASLLSPRNNNFNCLGKFEPQVISTTCKKSEEVRLQEVRSYIYDDLIEFLLAEDVLTETCTNRNLSKIVLGAIKSMQQDEYYDGLERLSNGVFTFMIADLTLKIEQRKIEQSYISDTFGSKLLKNIIFTTAKLNFCDQNCSKLAEIFSKSIKEVLESKATFVLSALVEKGGHDELLGKIKKSGVNFQKILIGKFYKDRLKGKK